MADQPDSWSAPQKISVILAHPDDPEFFCGATLARWALAGHEINYCILTCGNKGGASDLAPEQLCQIRHEEQQQAANVIGVKDVVFLDLEDGNLFPTLELRRTVVKEIRKKQPDVLVTCDPTLLYTVQGTLNHPDHRAAGQVVLDSVFPAAGNSHYFPEQVVAGFDPHTPREVWIALPSIPTVHLDITETWSIKLEALKKHKSQIGDPQKFEERMFNRRVEGTSLENPRFEERFRVIKLK